MSSFIPIDQSDIETFTIVTNPIRTYVSSSTAGVTGSVYLFARRSSIQKDMQPDSSFVESTHNDADLSSELRQVQVAGKAARSSDDMQSLFGRMIGSYLDAVNDQQQSRRTLQTLNVNRFTPPSTFNSNTLRKLLVKDTLQNYYRTSYPTAHWAYTNYNSLNFFTSSTVPTSSVLLYPNVSAGDGNMTFHEGYVSGTYTPSGSFSFDFYINPRYQPDARNGQFKAGTILHLSSTYALSLVSGSAKDANGRVIGYRLKLQLSHSADVVPSRATQGTYPNDLIFLSDDNSLSWNHWHHVVVRWGTNMVNAGTGTFNIDGVDLGTFLVPSSTITPRLFSGKADPNVLCVGNFYEGTNIGLSAQSHFFATDPATRDGLQELIPVTSIDAPASYSFNHPLNAEIHDLAIRRCYLSDLDIETSSSNGPTYLDNTFALYVPPFFVEASPYRQFVGTYGGVLVTPFEEIDGAPRTPFATALSFGVAGHYINLENFVRDFASNVFPRLHHLTGTALQTSTNAATANEFLYSQPFVVKRNLSILPCDDGLFVPSYQLLASETLARAVDDLGLEELSFISLDNMVSTGTLLFGGSSFDDGSGELEASEISSFADQQLGSVPETPFASAGPAFTSYSRSLVSGSDGESLAPLAIYQRTQDPSSNQVTFFDLSNMFYGTRIKPATLEMYDAALSGSGGAVKITLADDGRGNVYRADCLTSQSSWNCVGNVYYDEGIIVLKSPHVFFFGQDSYTMNFRGVQNIHVMKIDALAPNNKLNSSSNPSFVSVPINAYPNDPETDFVYITGLNFHDSDYNVVMKTALAQPIAKRHGDRLCFKVKFDM